MKEIKVTKIPPLSCPKCDSTRVTQSNPLGSRRKVIKCDDCHEETESGYSPQEKFNPAFFHALKKNYQARPRRGRRVDARTKKEKKGFADQQLTVDRFIEE